MIQAGVTVIPASPGNLGSVAEAARVAEDIGYPVMLKATSGGGGRGIRRCNSESELHTRYSRVVSEATKAFGCAELFIEKCRVAPRHIEVQVLADGLGNVVHLFERDCSVQRRHQKLVEIAPLMTPSASRVMITEVALRDGHQSLLATRMRTADMLPICSKLDEVGFWSLETWGGATFDTCVRFLNEDPRGAPAPAVRRFTQYVNADVAARAKSARLPSLLRRRCSGVRAQGGGERRGHLPSVRRHQRPAKP